MLNPSAKSSDRKLTLRAIAEPDLDQVLALDHSALGGLWNRDGYQREIGNDTSALVGLWLEPSAEDRKEAHREKQLIGLGCVWFIVDESHIVAIAVDSPHQHHAGSKL